MKRPAAFFDLDGTIIRKPSCERRFLYFLWKQGRLGWRQIIPGLLFYPRWLRRYGKDVGRKNKAFYNGIPISDMEGLSEKWVEENLSALLYPEIVEQIEYCRDVGYCLVLMTGAPAFLAKPICEKLQMDEYIATQCATEDEKFCATPPLRHPLGLEKLSLAKAWCKVHGVELGHCTAYGDSHQDYHLLNAVKQPFAINPDRRMQRIASNSEWPIIKSPGNKELSIKNLFQP